jgi:hypothetical protein
MVRKRLVRLVDDLDGGPADDTVRLNLDGIDYEIDLFLRNATTFHCGRTLADYIGAGRRAGLGRRRDRGLPW